jgi:hypothetical protein
MICIARASRVNPRALDAPLVSYSNPRTGKTSYIPAGIDPGFPSNPGKVGLRAAVDHQYKENLLAAEPNIARAVERLKAPVPRPDYASQPTLDEAIADGAKLAKTLNVPANNGTAQEFADFRKRLQARLRRPRGRAGTPLVKGDASLVRLVKQAARSYPGDWIVKANWYTLKVGAGGVWQAAQLLQ